MARIHKPVRITWRKMRECWGIAFPNRHEVYLDPRMEPRSLMSIAAHEIAHLYFPSSDEAVVNEFGEALADALYRMGFSHRDDD